MGSLAFGLLGYVSLFYGGVASGFRVFLVVILEQQWSERSPQVSLDIVGKYAEEHMSTNMVFAIDMDRADGQPTGFETRNARSTLAKLW